MRNKQNNNASNNDLNGFPNDWEIKPLSELLEFRNGANASKESYGSGVKFINVMDVLNNNFITAEKITGSVILTEQQILLNLVQRGDVVFNRTSETPEEVGLTSVYLDDEIAVFGGFVIRGRSINNKLDDEFKKFCFSTKFVRKQIIASGQGAIRSNIGQGDLEKILLPLPSISEQKKIAKILTTCDHAIEKTSVLISKKEKLKKALMQNLLTGKVRFKEFEKEKWQTKILSDFCKTFSGGTPLRSNKNYYGGEIPWLKSGELNKEKIFITEESITEEGLRNSSAKLAEARTILLALYGATAGVVAQTLINTTINQAILAIVPNDKLKHEYLFYYLKLIMPFELKRLLQGGQPNLSAEMIKDLMILIPSINQQTKIAEVLVYADNEIQNLKLQLDKLKLQKKTLMQLLLTGKVRVKI